MILVPSAQRESSVELKCNNLGSEFEHCLQDDSLEQCNVNRITNNNVTDEMSCETVCDIPPEKWANLCDEWNIENDCSVTQDHASFEAFIPKNQVNLQGQCLYFSISRASFDNRASSLRCPLATESLKCRVKCTEAEVVDVMSEEMEFPEVNQVKLSSQFNIYCFRLQIIITFGLRSFC